MVTFPNALDNLKTAWFPFLSSPVWFDVDISTDFQKKSPKKNIWKIGKIRKLKIYQKQTQKERQGNIPKFWNWIGKSFFFFLLPLPHIGF